MLKKYVKMSVANIILYFMLKFKFF